MASQATRGLTNAEADKEILELLRIRSHSYLTPCNLARVLVNKQERPYIIDQAVLVVPQNAIDIDLCLRITAPTTTLTSSGKAKVSRVLASYKEFVHPARHL